MLASKVFFLAQSEERWVAPHWRRSLRDESA